MKIIIGITAAALSLGLNAGAIAGENDVSAEHPYGRAHPEAPAALADFAFAIGKWTCASSSPQGDGNWDSIPLAWEFHYILNGRAVEDYFEDANIRGLGIRQFNQTDGKWHVAYHAEWPGHNNAMWVGGKNGDGDIVLDRTITRPDGGEVIMRLSFHDITGDSFKWHGEFVNGETVNEFWRISCDERLG